MIQLHHFVFNEFLENTYVIWDETGECVIIDPGCHHEHEKEDLKKFIEGKKLKPVLLLNTHCHLDHVFGNKWITDAYGIPFKAHEADLFLLKAMLPTAQMYGMFVDQSPLPGAFLKEGDEVKFGSSTLQVLFTPGHSPGCICFYAAKEKLVISGDVLFQSSIGRTDLPGGDYETLMHSILYKLLILPDEVQVCSGHGPATTIGTERRNNPFVLEYLAELEAK